MVRLPEEKHSEDIRRFLSSLSGVTGLAFSFAPEGSREESRVFGESSFCLLVNSTAGGSFRCQASLRDLLERADSAIGPMFDVCHAGLGMVAVRIGGRGGAAGTVVVRQALMGELTVEHKDMIAALARDVEMDDPDRLVAAAAQNPVFTRSRLEQLALFVRDQLEEMIEVRGRLEDTTQYLLEKYEELMFLYSVAETLSPETHSHKSLAVIMDRGVQKLSARWSLILRGVDESPPRLEVLESYGRPAGDLAGGNVLPGLSAEISACSGPALLAPRGLGGTGAEDAQERLLVCPFRLKSGSAGYLLFGLNDPAQVGDGEMRFADALGSQCALILHTAHLYRELADLLFSTLGALSSAIDAKDPYTHGHSNRVADYSVMTANHMGFSSKSLTMLKVAGLLHDFGKIGVREQILSKSGKLDGDEMRLMREHPAIGAKILANFKAFSDIVPGIRHHHERYDGKGYPDGLSGGDIPLVGRIISVADAFDAMTTSRPYRAKRSLQEAFGELRAHAGAQFDPEVVESFVLAMERRYRGEE